MIAEFTYTGEAPLTGDPAPRRTWQRVEAKKGGVQ